jgi:hypothetical protein
MLVRSNVTQSLYKCRLRNDPLPHLGWIWKSFWYVLDGGSDCAHRYPGSPHSHARGGVTYSREVVALRAFRPAKKAFPLEKLLYRRHEHVYLKRDKCYSSATHRAGFACVALFLPEGMKPLQNPRVMKKRKRQDLTNI